eukprot:TRINITY_DN18884_c0_g1_i1.p1 TRINITY_DN18884_c0_g1~~TRINITY_DN18884_c0_g1_i1.p1  ORF type:complete len:221 (-),score=43.85 TRINITY_DN18884_c0_g1_i1:105-767(-)
MAVDSSFLTSGRHSDSSSPMVNELRSALTAGRFGDVAQICDRLELEAVSSQNFNAEEWPYTVHLLGHLYNNDLNSARFAWKRMPQEVKMSNSEAAAAWEIGKGMWKRDRSAVYAAVNAFNWSPEVTPLLLAVADGYRRRMAELIRRSYSDIAVTDAASFLGLPQTSVASYLAAEGGSKVEVAENLIHLQGDQELASSLKGIRRQPAQLQRLTEYMFHLDQ